MSEPQDYDQELRDLLGGVRPDADKGREPKLVEGRMGTRMYSLAALRERVVLAFEQEHSTNSPALLAAQTRTDKLKLLRDVTNYVLAVESVRLPQDEQANLIREAYADLFTYGPLDELFADERVTTITLEGSEKAAVRYEHADLVTLDPVFEDGGHLQRVLNRLVKDAGAEIRAEQPYMEVGLTVEGRPVAVNLVLPPVVIQPSADIRVHPKALPPLESLVTSPLAVTLLTAIARSPHGFVVVGEAESGKTTLLAMLLALADTEGVIAVERAGELHLPEGVQRLKTQWAVGDVPEVSFGHQIAAALEQAPQGIVLDEVRADEPGSIVPLLTAANPPRQMWAFRGPADSKRLSSALGMVARRGDAQRGEQLARAIYERLPFVITIRRRKDQLQLHSISEWQFPPGSDYPDFVELLAMGWEDLELTGKRPARALGVGDDFWG